MRKSSKLFIKSFDSVHPKDTDEQLDEEVSREL
jgi:hypothetical protein